MVNQYKKYEISVDKLNLPVRKLPTNMTISNLRGKSNFNKLLNLFLNIFPDEIDSEKEMQLRDFREQNFNGLFIAEFNQEIIGFLISGISGVTGYILYIGVLNEYRSLGIATNLLNRFISYLNQKKVQNIQCNIREDNKKTLSYVTYLGFKKCEL